jgi:hypothetical protein
MIFFSVGIRMCDVGVAELVGVCAPFTVLPEGESCFILLVDYFYFYPFFGDLCVFASRTFVVPTGRGDPVDEQTS